MRSKLLIVLAVAGIVAGILSARIYGARKPPLPPVFPPAQDPYAKGIYANGIIESSLANGENINIFPEVAGTVTQIPVSEGDTVSGGTSLLLIDDSIQKATVEQQKASAQSRPGFAPGTQGGAEKRGPGSKCGAGCGLGGDPEDG